MAAHRWQCVAADRCPARGRGAAGDKLVVHSLSGGERNHYFANAQGRAFTDLSALSGMDSPLDSRGFAVLDYDRDGWQDVAMVNAANPLFILYHNEIAASGTAHGGNMVAIRFVGAADKPAASTGKACRDGFGAKVFAELADGLTLLRQHRCGDGYAAQHSATMIVGTGTQPGVKKLTVRWPSGALTTDSEIPEGTLVTVYEDPSQSSDGKAVRRSPYRRSTGPTPPAAAPEAAVFPPLPRPIRTAGWGPSCGFTAQWPRVLKVRSPTCRSSSGLPRNSAPKAWIWWRFRSTPATMRTISPDTSPNIVPPIACSPNSMPLSVRRSLPSCRSHWARAHRSPPPC